MSLNDQIIEAAKAGDSAGLVALLDRNPDALHVRAAPYEWSLLHLAAHAGHLAVVELLLARGLDVNTREKGDNTYAIHWAAAGGHLAVVRVLADAGGDVIGRGDDHDLDVIGWATCWDGCDDAAHRAVAELLVARGARHHVFSAIAMDLADVVRDIVAADPSQLHRRMSRNENHQRPLHFAVRMNRPRMVSLLMELGADPLSVDASGFLAAAYATTPDADRPVMTAIASMTAAEMISAARGARPPKVNTADLIAALALGDMETAGRVVQAGDVLDTGGALHLMARRGDRAGVQWLLARGADPNKRWNHWDSEVTPLHLAVLGGHANVVQVLLDAGADPRIVDSKHDSDAIGWARFFGRTDLVEVLSN